MNLVRLASRQLSQQAQEQQNAWASGCHAYDPAVESTFNYVPSLAPGLVFTIVFALSLVAHTGQFIYTRKWWYSTFALVRAIFARNVTLGPVTSWLILILSGCPW